MIADGAIPPTIAIMPDAPWSSRASYYVDSQYKGSDRKAPNPAARSRPAFTTGPDPARRLDVPHDSPSRDGRVIGGYSMGGYGAIRYSLAHPDLFAASIVLSPAVYSRSRRATRARASSARSARDGRSSPTRSTKLNYPAELPRFARQGLQSHMFIAVGDDEYQNPNRGLRRTTSTSSRRMLYKSVEREPNLTSELRVMNGGHDWEVWGPAFEEGAKYAFQFVARPRGADHEGDAHRTARARTARAASRSTPPATSTRRSRPKGTIDGQPNAGAKDVVLIKYGPTGTKLWTTQFGTAGTDRAYGLALDPAGHPVIAGYTKGNLDGATPATRATTSSSPRSTRTATASGRRRSAPDRAADRGYGLAIGPRRLDLRRRLHARARSGAVERRRQGRLPRCKLAGHGGAPTWIDQFGTRGEDKGMAVAAGGGVRLCRRHGRRHARHTAAGHDARRRRRLPRAVRRERQRELDEADRHGGRRAALGRRRRRGR